MTAITYGPEEGEEDVRITGKSRTFKGWEQEPNFESVELIPANNVQWHEEEFKISINSYGFFVFYSENGVINVYDTLDQAREAAQKLHVRIKRSPKRKVSLKIVGIQNSSYGLLAGKITSHVITGLHMGNGEFTGFGKDINKNAYIAVPDTPDARAILQKCIDLRKKMDAVDKAIKSIRLVPPARGTGYKSSYGKIAPEEYAEKLDSLEAKYHCLSADLNPSELELNNNPDNPTSKALNDLERALAEIEQQTEARPSGA